MKNFYNYNLLIENYADLIKSTIEKNKTVIIKGPTGCGKSTYVPLLLDFNNKKIAIIEPRRIAVTSLYNILSPVINKRVGYKMRFNKKLDKDTNMIIYTDGAFLNDIQYKEFDYIILDEVHERSIRTDVILSILKKLKSKVILMSATVDTIKIQKYCDAKVIEIEGVSYPVKIIHNEEPVSDYLIEAYTIIKGIVLDDKKRKEKLKRNFKNKNKKSIDDEVNEFLEIKNESEEDYIGNYDGEDYGNLNPIHDTNIIDNNLIDSNKDILVFLTGEEDINELYKLLKRILNIQVFKIYSSLSDSEQSKIFEDSPLRKVILSTNICETSLTIPGIKYVIDCGLSKTKIFDKIEYMGILAISKESEEQRTGRCNRTGPGICYRLYPKMKMLPLIPEIKRTDLSNCILQLTKFGINIFECEFLDYPSQTNVLYALKFLLKKKLINLKIKNGKNKYEIREESVCKVDSKVDSKVDNKGDNKIDNKVECKDDSKVDKLNSLDNNISYLLDNIFNLKFKIFITNYGKIINSLPFDVNLSCFYQDCLSNNVSYYGSILTAMISLNNYNFIKNVSECDSIKNSKSNSTKSLSITKPDTIKLNNSFKSDLEFLINLFEDFLNSENKFIFCKEKGVSQKFLEKASNIFYKLNKKKNDKNDILILEKVFSTSFSYNKSIKEKDGSYTHLESNRKVYIHPTSCYFKKSEKKIVFVDVLCTTKEYVRIVGKYYKG